MNKTFVFASLLCLVAIVKGCGCGESRGSARRKPNHDPDSVQNAMPGDPSRTESGRNLLDQMPKPPPTPEEVLGIDPPGKLAASVEAWALSNELGEYFRQSRNRLSHLHAQLIEDYNVRKESELAPTDFTRETLRQYHEAYDADVMLRKFMVECYSRKEVRPLPQTISRRFTTAGEERAEVREYIEAAPAQIERLNAELVALISEIDATGTASWSQEKDLPIWRDLQIRVRAISVRANKASASASALAANMAKAARLSGESEDVNALSYKAKQLKADLASFAAQAAQQLEIANGQVLITEFSANCKDMAEGMIAVREAFARKKERQAEINDLISLISSSRTRGYADLDALAQQTAAIKSRSRSEGEQESILGTRVQKLAGKWEQTFGTSAIYRLKRSLPAPSAQARIDTEFQSFKRAINLPQGTDPAGAFAGIESKAYQLADRMEEESMLKRLDETLLTVQRLAARRR